jgi:hypothetical protein
MTRKNSNRSKPSYVRRLGLERAVKSGFYIFVKGKIRPSIALGLPRKVVRSLAEKACRERVNRENVRANRKARKVFRKKNKQAREFNDLANAMPSWQRHYWARRISKDKASYVGLRHKDVKALAKFIKNNPTQPER